MSFTSLLVSAAAEHPTPNISPYAVGGGVLLLLVLVALGLLAFGAGRDHS